MTIYTDGACSLKYGYGAFGIYVPEHNFTFCQVVKKITNNEAELMAFIYALQYAKRHNKEILIVSDSMYVLGGYNEWMYNWNISTRKNADLWQMIFDLKEKQGAKYLTRHCRGHGKGTHDLPEDIKGNDVIDKMVSKAVQEASKV